MILNGIIFPNKIIDSVQNNRLVVFAGAGVSVNAPTSLPGFEKLAKQIADGTGIEYNNKESCEVFLGSLKAKGIPVNVQAAELLSDNDRECNKLHEAIINLFPEPSLVRIVTTNYDNMFEKAVKNTGTVPIVYNAPALPLGNDVNGIIHLHGNVQNPTYMIVTDEDFGKAYLTDGYASRFLVKLFASYTVLFVGYSYNDMILRYLTRAMSRELAENSYILTSDDKADWSVLGINPIYYPRRAYTALQIGIEKLGQRCKRSLLEWKNQLLEIGAAPPKDLTVDTEVDYCLEDIAKTQILADSVTGLEWLDLLNRKGVFKALFSSSSILGERDRIWATWITDHFVGTNDEQIRKLIFCNNNQISNLLAEIIISKLISANALISNDSFSEYVVLVEKHLNDPWKISMLLEKAANRKLSESTFRLFVKLMKESMYIEKCFWPDNSDYQYKHALLGEQYHISHSWEISREVISKNNAKELLYELFGLIEKIHRSYEAVGQASKEKEAVDLAMMVIEDRQDNYHEEPLSCVIQIIIDLLATLERNAEDLAVGAYQYGIQSDSQLLRKIVLKGMRFSSALLPSEKIEYLLKYCTLDFPAGKEQVFLLVASVFDLLTRNEKDHLIDLIETLSPVEDERSSAYARYNWCVWLNRECEKDERVSRLMEMLANQYGFLPRDYPERSIVTYCSSAGADQSPVTTEELTNKKDEELIALLTNYQGEKFDGPTRWGLLDVFSNAVMKNPNWTNHIIHLFFEKEVHNEDLWDRLIRGIEDGKYSLSSRIELLEILSGGIHAIPETSILASLLFSIIRDEEIEQCYIEETDKLFTVSTQLLSKRKDEIQAEMRTIDMTLNTTIGQVLLVLIKMISLDGKQPMGEKYKRKFEKALSLSSWELDVSTCVLAGHFNFLYSVDPKWTTEKITPLLTGGKTTGVCSSMGRNGIFLKEDQSNQRGCHFKNTI